MAACSDWALLTACNPCAWHHDDKQERHMRKPWQEGDDIVPTLKSFADA